MSEGGSRCSPLLLGLDLGLGLGLGVRQRQEPSHAQALAAKADVEPFHESIVRRLASWLMPSVTLFS